MKALFSLARRLPARRRDLLQLAIVVNQLATPGLGSWMAGRTIAGTGQMAVVLVGFLGFLVHLYGMLRDSWIAAWNGLDAPPLSSALLNRSLAIMGIAWLWAGISSLGMLLELRTLRRTSDSTLPPPLNPEPPRLSGEDQNPSDRSD